MVTAQNTGHHLERLPAQRQAATQPMMVSTVWTNTLNKKSEGKEKHCIPRRKLDGYHVLRGKEERIE